MTTFQAMFYKYWDQAKINMLRVLPPYEPKDRVMQWVRGSIRYLTDDNDSRELVVTGPKLRVCYGGCNWNRIVFAMNDHDEDIYDFQQWLYMVADHVKREIFNNPGKFKNGATSSVRFSFDEEFIKPPNDPSRYPSELRCRLSTRREYCNQDSDGLTTDVVDADLYTRLENGTYESIDHRQITAGSYIIPVLKFSYYRNGERFGMSITVLKGVVELYDKSARKIENNQWEIDYPMDQTL